MFPHWSPQTGKCMAQLETYQDAKKLKKYLDQIKIRIWPITTQMDPKPENYPVLRQSDYTYLQQLQVIY